MFSQPPPSQWTTKSVPGKTALQLSREYLSPRCGLIVRFALPAEPFTWLLSSYDRSRPHGRPTKWMIVEANTYRTTHASHTQHKPVANEKQKKSTEHAVQDVLNTIRCTNQISPVVEPLPTVCVWGCRVRPNARVN